MNPWFIWEIFVNAITIVAEFYLLYKKLGVSPQKKTYIVWGTIAFTIILSVLNYIDLTLAINITPGFTVYANRYIVALLLFTFSVLIFKGNISEKLMWSLVPILLIAIADFISLTVVPQLFQTNLDSVVQYGPERFWITVINILVICISCILLANTKNKKETNKLTIPRSVQNLLIIILIIGTMSVDILIDHTVIPLSEGHTIVDAGEIFVCITFLVIIFSTFFLVTRVGVLSHENMTYELETQKRKMEHAYFNNLALAIDGIREIRHDFKNNIGVMQILLAKKEYNELSNYFDEINGHYQEKTDIVLTDNTTLNSLIYSKMLIMKSNGITFDYNIKDVTQIPISPLDLCSILGNLLDNAVEACIKLSAKQEKRYISLNIKRQENMLVIKIINNYNGQYNKNFITSKRGKGHGLGLKHVGKIANDHNGHIQVSPTDHQFVVFVFLPYQNH